MRQSDLSFHIDKLTRIDVIIPSQPRYTIDEVEFWLVSDNTSICLYKDSWNSSFLYESVHVVKRFRIHSQQNHYSPDELEYRYFRQLTSGIIDNAIWDYLLFSCKRIEVFLAEGQDGCAVLMIAEMNPYTDAPMYRRIAQYKVERDFFLSWFDKLVSEVGVRISSN